MATSSRAVKKYVAIERAKRRLAHRLDDIDWELDELTPAVEGLKKLEARNTVVDVELEPGDLSEDLD